MRDRVAAAVIATVVALASCKRAPGGDRAQAPNVSPEQAAPAVPFEVRGGTADLLFFWFSFLSTCLPLLALLFPFHLVS